MGRFGQAPIGSLPTRSNRIWVSAARPRPTDQRKDTRSLIRRGQTCSDSNTIMLTVIGIALAADRRRDTGVHGGDPIHVPLNSFKSRRIGDVSLDVVDMAWR